MRLWELEEGDGIGVDRQNFHNVPEVEEEEVEEEEYEDGDDEVAVDFVDDDHPHPALPAVFAAPQAQQLAPQAPPRVRVNARVQQGLARPGAAAEPHPGRGRPVQGLQRFLQMVENDEEDEWNSDELDDDDEEGHDDRWVIPVR